MDEEKEIAMKVERVDTDVLIIGSGIAGLQAALEARKLGKRVIIVSKSPVGKANNTSFAGGGFTFATESFPPEEHLRQTLKSGRMINDYSLVACMAKDAPARVEELVKMGLEGDYRKTGFWCQSSSMIGGPKITGLMVRACRKTDIRIFENIMITDLIVSESVCRGALGFQKQSGRWYGFESKAVVLATGGAGAAYAKSNNAPGATGDGYALALKAGLELRDMEFVQFHSMVYAGKGHASMIIPSVFADLGDILNRYGEDIKAKYGLNEKPVAMVSRDRFAQAVFHEVRQGNDVDGALFLDLRQMDGTNLPYADKLKARFKRRILWDVEPVRITQACHHTMGGVPIDVDGRTDLKGLYASGEVTGGLHGANRIGGNALSEGLVFGTRAARSAAADIESDGDFKKFESLLNDYAKKWKRLLNSETIQRPAVSTIMASLKQLLWEKVGIVRDGASLKDAIKQIEKVLQSNEFKHVRTPQELRKRVECANMAMAGMAIAVSAFEREESRGSHYREDFSSEVEHWISHIHVSLTEGSPAVSRVVPIQ
jgi:succinate dehydrogenase/fumarate reductase flavoprotein subunit